MHMAKHTLDVSDDPMWGLLDVRYDLQFGLRLLTTVTSPTPLGRLWKVPVGTTNLRLKT